MVGRNGFTAKTTDYGKTWTDISDGTSAYYSVTAYGAAMLATGASGLLRNYSTTFGWSTVATGTTATLNDITYYSTYTYLASVPPRPAMTWMPRATT
ncbi:hypothetical protein HZA87_04940 [Candidatus Uhrbacteria bacterium]|nr:hypothetical protein [Candidatus Uhrbacteria bacterium]